MSETDTLDGRDLNRQGSVVTYFSQNYVAANVLFALLVVGGLIATDFIRLETFPTYDPRTIRVKVPYPGAIPLEVERDIVERIEESLVGTIGVERTISSSQHAVATVDVEIEPGANAVETLNHVRTAIERIEDFPPLFSDQPEIELVDVNRVAVTLAISSHTLDAYDLRKAAESIRDQLLLYPTIAIGELVGTRDQEIQIEVSEEQLREHGLSITELVLLIRHSSVNVTGGDLRTQAGEIVMSTLDKRDFAKEFSDIVVVARPDGSLIRLGDIATLRDGLLEHSALSTIDDVPTVFLQIKVSGDSFAQRASADVHEYLASATFPEEVDVSIWQDETWNGEDRIYLIVRNGVLGIILVFLTLLLLFDLRIAIWITAGVPAVFMGVLVVFPVIDISINVITLFGFFVLIGLVVDDSIIIGESVASQREQGITGVDAAIQGTRAVIGPVVIGALTTMVAFGALLPLDGLVGQLFAAIPAIAIAVLLLSLFEAYMVLPGHLARQHQWSLWPLSIVQAKLQRSLSATIDSRIVPIISWSVRKPHWPPVIVAASVLFAALLLIFNVVPYDRSLRIVDEQSLQVDLTFSPDARPSDVERAVTHVKRAAHDLNRIVGGNAIHSVASIVGHHFPTESFEGIESNLYHGNQASVQLRLYPSSMRDITVDELRQRWQQALRDAPDVELMHFPSRQTYASGERWYAVSHVDANALIDATTQLRTEIATVHGVMEIRDSFGIGKRRLDVDLTEAGQAAGLTPAGIATQLRNSFYGAEVQRIQRGREEILVMVRYPEERRTRYAELLDERINLPGTPGQAPLATVARLEESYSIGNRMRIDGRPSVILAIKIDPQLATESAVANVIENEILPTLTQQHPGLEIEPSGVTRNVERAGNILWYSIPIALLVIYCLIASYLHSFLQPLLALAGIPMAFVGAVIGHLILGYEFSYTSFFGLIAVCGVVVNDTILLLARHNRILIESNVPVIAAISAASRQRARAILLASASTVLGLLPMLFTKHESIEFLIPLVVSITFGLTFAGIGLLFFLPAVTMLTELIRSAWNLPGVDTDRA
ncbi:MAG: efflux RND transporter permease subunit [Gammaproteobacteria bacterium]|nr:efflux RND transporter permease subunit [Gammaproteobacteria bacterium]